MTHQEQPSVALHTFGCRLNQYETEAIRARFLARGFREVAFEDQATVYVVNTCTVTAQADYQARQALRRAIRRAPDALIVATGCYAQTDANALLEIEGVDLVLGNKEKSGIVDFVLEAQRLGTPTAHVTRRSALSEFDDTLDVEGFDTHTRALLKIQDGCDQFCSFCIIPWARGRHRSRPVTSILKEINRFIASGYQEVVLTGVHLGEFGTDLNPQTSLTSVVEQIFHQGAPPRLRLSSLWPTAVTNGLVDLMAQASPPFCRYLHLAIQHGENTVLSAMRRTYTVEQTTAVIDRVVDNIPDICVGADIMTGFPGESDAHFDQMYRWLADQPLAYFHVFPFSRRKHTSASSLPDQVPPSITQDRSKRLRELSAAKSAAFHARFVQKTVTVLVESHDDNGRVSGLTDTYIKVNFPGTPALVNRIIPVTILETDAGGAIGEQSG